jgi:hypothetical protein
MTEPTEPEAQPEPTPPEPGDVPPPGARRRLERPPSERYRPAEASAEVRRRGSMVRAVAFGLVAAVAGIVVFTLVAGPLAVDAGLVVVAGVMGLAIGRAVVTGAGTSLPDRQRIGLAVVLFVAALLGAELATWQFALSEGGVLGPVDYLRDTFGFLVVLELLAGLIGSVIAAA